MFGRNFDKLKTNSALNPFAADVRISYTATGVRDNR